MTVDNFTLTPLPEDNPDAWNNVDIEGIVLPCLRSLPEAKVGRKVDAKGHAGSDSVTVTDKGQDVNQVKIVIKVWLDEHWKSYDSLVQTVAARKRLTDRRPLAIYHPVLAQLGITHIYAINMSSLKFSEAGMYEGTIEAYEFRENMLRRTTRRATQQPADFTRNTAFTPTIQQATQQTLASLRPATPSASGASNP